MLWQKRLSIQSALKKKNSFFDFLRTERVQETVRNIGYIDTKGKTKEQIAQEMQDKYGEIFVKNGKKLEINFYVSSEVSQDDPDGKNKMNSAGVVAEDGSIWLNVDNISSISNFNLNSVFGHELTHNTTGKDTELLANFGEARASEFKDYKVNMEEKAAVEKENKVISQHGIRERGAY